VIAALLSGVALIAAFLVCERAARSPMIPLALFRSRGFASANAVSFFMYAGLFGALFLMSQFLQTRSETIRFRPASDCCRGRCRRW